MVKLGRFPVERVDTSRAETYQKHTSFRQLQYTAEHQPSKKLFEAWVYHVMIEVRISFVRPIGVCAWRHTRETLAAISDN